MGARVIKYTLAARGSTYKLGARAVKYILGTRGGTYKLGARAGKHRLGARAGKHRLEVGAGTKGQGRGPGNTNTLKRIKTGENYAETIIAMAENVRTSSTTKQILTTFNELKARCRYC